MSRLKRQRISDRGQDKVTAYATDDAETAVANDRDDPPKSQHGTRSLFVRSLPASATSESLAAFFSQSYPIKHATAVIDKSTKQCKGFGFVTFADAEDARRAQKDLNGAQFESRKLMVDEAEPRQREPVSESALPRQNAVKERYPKPTDPPPKLIVRNLPWTIKSQDQLQKLFLSYGKVKHVNLPKRKAGQSPGFGFVVLRGRKNAANAIQKLNGKEIDGRTIAVDWAVDKEVWGTLQANEPKTLDEESSTGSVKSEDGDNPDFSEVPASEDGISVQSDEEDRPKAGDVNLRDRSPSPRKVSEVTGAAPTLFVRNLTFTTDDDSLRNHFAKFGPIRYARVVKDTATDQSKGVGFVSFFNADDATSCLKKAPRSHSSELPFKSSLLEDDRADKAGTFLLDGRTVQISRAVDRVEAARLAVSNAKQRNTRDNDKRRAYLLAEGTLSADDPLMQKLSPVEIKMREESAKQRRALINSNPTLHLSLTRLSVRNLPRSITSKGLKALAREAVVRFAEDVKSGVRKQLSKEELARGGETMKLAEKDRKAKGKGIVKQAKIVCEGRDGAKVAEGSGAGRSRGYGFIEYYSHRSALMGLRWLNGHLVNPSKPQAGEEIESQSTTERKRRLIVEFAVENAQVVQRRQQRESKARDRGASTRFEDSMGTKDTIKEEEPQSDSERKGAPQDKKVSDRQRIIGRKRASRKARKGKGSSGN